MTASTKLLTPGGGGVILTPAASTASDVTLSLPTTNGTLATQAYATQMGGMRNRIINGAMMIDQRNNGAAVTSSAGAGANWAVDRFQTNVAGTSAVVTAQRVSDAPSGFINSLKITVTTAATATAAQFTFVRQIIEGLNISDLGWGTADAQPVTLSFWFKASITGTYSAFAINHAEDRSYVATFAVNAANTWEYKTITIPGDTTGTWLTTNSNGIRFGFDLGSGANYQGTANIWNSGWRQRTSSTVNLIGTNGATLQFTGLQVEKGTVATPFEYRQYGTELALCQRYFVRFMGTGAYEKLPGAGIAVSATTAYYAFSLPVQMRSSPTMSVGTIAVYDGSGNTAVTSIGVDNTSPLSPSFIFTFGSGVITAFRPVLIQANNSTAAAVNLNSEL